MSEGYILDYYETARQFIDLCNIEFTGRVLDIGGGGEGIISQHSGDKVIAIDNRADELTATPDIGLKIVMDACLLNFLDSYFDNITCFYTLLYMDTQQIEQFLNEAYRVLKNDALLWIWDAVIPADKTADVFIAQLDIKISEQTVIKVGYGASWIKEQSLAVIKALCEKAGFAFHKGIESNESFSLCLRKRRPYDNR